MADLITLTHLTDRVEFDVDTTRASAYITDASALVRDEANGELDATTDADVPDVIVPVVVSAVRRALVNPDGHGGEAIDDYQASQMHREGVFLTRDEKRTIRRWAGVLSSGTVTLEGYLPTSDEPVESAWLDGAVQ